jgi:hypothetical protein
MAHSMKILEKATIFRANSLWPNEEGKSCTGFNSTVRNIGSGSVTWLGYNLINNDAAARFLQIFFRPASEVILGTTPNDEALFVPANGTIFFQFQDWLLQGRALSVACTTTENGFLGPTANMTGSIYYVP